MLRINPFCAIRPASGHESRVASVPYDVVSTVEARQLAEGNPESFLRVVRPELELADDCDPYAPETYERARQNFQRLLLSGVLRRDNEPGMFLYRQTWQDSSQIGLVCCCHVDDYENNIIKKHEKTRRAKEDDRTRHILAVNAHTGPVFLTYQDRSNIDRLVAFDTNARPVYHFRAVDNVTHTVWRVSSPDDYVRHFADVPWAYVADGHHRAASAWRASAARRGANSDHKGTEEYNWFLVALLPAGQLNILPYNRVVRDLNGVSADEVLRRIAQIGTVSDSSDPTPDRAGVTCCYLEGRWHRIEFSLDAHSRRDPIASLDVSILQDRILEPILGVGDPRTDERIDFVGGIRGTSHLASLVDRSEAAIAFSMYPTSIEQLIAVSDAGLVMPPKSTWFEPKLRSGLLVHALD